MKEIFLLSSLLLVACISQAQKGKFTLSAGTTNNVATFYDQDNADKLKITLTGTIPIHVEAGYYLSDKFQLALSYNRSSYTSDELDLSSLGYGKVSWESVYSSYMLKANYFYINTEKFKLGSGIGLGTLVQDANYKQTGGTLKAPESESKSGFSIHLNILDARYFFAKNIGVYATGGFVKQGIWGLGVIGRF